MIYLIMILSLLIPLFIATFFLNYYLKNKEVSSPNIQENKNTSLFSNSREYFRVSLINQVCNVKFIYFECHKLDRLKNKTFYAAIENVSIGGIKLNTKYNLPVNKSILVQVTFSLKEENFSFKGEIVRKEELNHSELIGYGVHFIEVSEDKKIALQRVLNQIIVERKRKDSNQSIGQSMLG